VQINPIKPTLKAPGIKLLKLKYDKPLSNLAFKFNLRRYTKAIISAVANLVIYDQHSHNTISNGDGSPEWKAGVVSQLGLCPEESAMRAVWDTCNQLIDVPDESGVGDHAVDDEDVCGDEEVARMAYGLALCDVAITNHGFMAPELLANRGHSGQWADRAIAALLTDLRHLGRAVQVDPITPKLKPPGTQHLKLNCDILLSTSAFKFNSRRYTWDRARPLRQSPPLLLLHLKRL